MPLIGIFCKPCCPKLVTIIMTYFPNHMLLKHNGITSGCLISLEWVRSSIWICYTDLVVIDLMKVDMSTLNVFYIFGEGELSLYLPYWAEDSKYYLYSIWKMVCEMLRSKWVTKIFEPIWKSILSFNNTDEQKRN